MLRFIQLAFVAWVSVGGEAAHSSESQAIFVDRAAEAGLDFVHFNGMSGQLYIVEHMGSGAALFDYDNDGDLDLYVGQGHMLGDAAESVFPLPAKALTDRLYRNDSFVGPDGELELRFADVTEVSGVDAPGYAMGVAVGDYDDDGWTDLYVTNFGGNQMWRNNGDGTFTDTTDVSGTHDPRWSVAAAFLDFDKDGRLDLYLANYIDFALWMAERRKCPNLLGINDYCAPAIYQPLPDRLFWNRGDGTFEDWSARAGILSEAGPGLGISVADFDGDDWPDIYVANDQTENHLWINRRGDTFVNMAVEVGSAVNRQGDPEASMGVDAGDFDGDGDEDLFMTHITRQSNTLYVNAGGLFRDDTARLGLSQPSWDNTGFGTAWLDYDNDGWLDLLAVNGKVLAYLTPPSENDPFPLHEVNQLFRNLGGVRFEQVPAEIAGRAFELSEVSRGAAFGDVDNDGDTDVVVVNNSGPLRLLINQIGQDRGWLGLRASDRATGAPIVGARSQTLLPGGRSVWRRARAAGSYASASDPRIVTGTGEFEPDSVRIRWPRGGTTLLTDPPLGSYSVVYEAVGETTAPRPMLRASSVGDYAGAAACRDCHREIYDSAVESAHHRDSAVATEATVLGSFEPGRNRLPTAGRDQALVMERLGQRLYQSLVEEREGKQAVVRREPFDFVLGNTKGQSYLYWGEDGILRELPASYLVPIGRWIFSPGFGPSFVHFDREIPAECLSCHATYTDASLGLPVQRSDELILGITCERCHGPGSEHVRLHAGDGEETAHESMVKIRSLERDRQLDLCGQCHSGASLGRPRRPPFEFRPGDALEDSYAMRPPAMTPTPEVHSNQLALLGASRCFLQSDSMTCTTCHDPHANQRGRRDHFVARCLTCHEPDACGRRHGAGEGPGDCVDCHMPESPSQVVIAQTEEGPIAVKIRTHWIKVYPSASVEPGQTPPAEH